MVFDALHDEDGCRQHSCIFSLGRDFASGAERMIGAHGIVDAIRRQDHAAATDAQIVDQLQAAASVENRNAAFGAFDQSGNIGDRTLALDQPYVGMQRDEFADFVR